MSEKERAEKLAERFSNKKQDNQSNKEENRSSPSDIPDTSNSSNTSNTDIRETEKETDIEEKNIKKGESVSIRDRKTKLLYLDEDLLNNLEITFDEINLMYKRKHGEQLQKNKHYYPKLLELALEKLENPREKDIEEIEDLLDIQQKN